MQYSEALKEHFRNPHNQGVIKDADGVGEVGNIKCGDIMKIYIKVKGDPGDKGDKGDSLVIEDIKFETLGCAAAISATSVLTDLAMGKTFKEAMAITKDDIVAELGDVPPVKFHCSILAEEALQKAIKNYKNK